MSMRKQFVNTVETILANDNRTVCLLGDIGVFGFRNAFKNFPSRVYNIGILEQSTVSLAAGLAKTGLIPIVHTIAPFLVERSFEQIKIDFGYQELGGNFVSVGNSYDYASLGCTHHCPGDVGVLKNIPNMQIILPGTSSEFDLIFKQTYANNMPTYFRLSERENPISVNVSFGKANVLQTGKLATVIAVGTALHATYEAIKGLDVTLLYYTTVSPFDAFTLKNNLSSNKVILCEPYYEGVLAAEIYKATKPKPISLDCIGVPHRFITKYGKAEDIDKHTELTTFHIKKRIKEFIY